ncbi:MAG: hypothetical protein ACI30R_07700, partial [Sodaliphilus sp.]
LTQKFKELGSKDTVEGGVRSIPIRQDGIGRIFVLMRKWHPPEARFKSYGFGILPPHYFYYSLSRERKGEGEG